ncbi:hypothetical protein Hdeb2414_s0369g00878501 [Helianthus debilis subsp. tardiflorus]
MSSMNTITDLSNMGRHTRFIRSINAAGAFVNPKDMTKKRGLWNIFFPYSNLMVPRT